jgi:tetratricopeptide (TPR) repeat protein
MDKNLLTLKSNEIFNKAIQCYKNNNLKEAEKLFNQILKKFPNHFETIFYLCQILIKLKNFLEAKKLCEKAIKSNPDSAPAHHNLGQVFKELGETKKAAECYGKAIKLQPNLIASHNNLGNIFKELGENKKAEQSFLNIIKLQPNSFVAYNNLGIIYQKIKKYNKAIENFKKSIKINNNFYMAHYNLGKSYKVLSKYEEAAKCFEMVNTTRSRAELLESIYFSNNLEKYNKVLKKLSKEDYLNLRVATLATYVSKKENIYNEYPFCKKPLDYIFITNLKKDINLPKTFSINLSKALNKLDLIWQPTTKSTKGGYHSAGNLFNNSDSVIVELKKLIKININIYRDKFKLSNDFFISKWPKKSEIEGWHVRLVKKGFQNSHIHPSGWLSGCFYLKIPKKLKKNEGAIKFSLSGYDYPYDKNLPNFSYTPEIFDIVLFPSSLFHETVPFNNKDERHVIAFDIMPN